MENYEEAIAFTAHNLIQKVYSDIDCDNSLLDKTAKALTCQVLSESLQEEQQLCNAAKLLVDQVLDEAFQEEQQLCNAAKSLVQHVLDEISHEEQRLCSMAKSLVQRVLDEINQEQMRDHASGTNINVAPAKSQRLCLRNRLSRGLKNNRNGGRVHELEAQMLHEKEIASLQQSVDAKRQELTRVETELGELKTEKEMVVAQNKIIDEELTKVERSIIKIEVSDKMLLKQNLKKCLRLSQK